MTERIPFISLDTSSAWPKSNDAQTIDNGDHHAKKEEDNNNDINRKGSPDYIFDFLTKQTLYESNSSENSDND